MIFLKETNFHEIYFYRDKNGVEPVYEYIKSLQIKKDAQSRKKADKILDYIDVLSKRGTFAGEPYIKHVEGELWELRPWRDRIFFVAWHEGSFVLLHHFMKKTQKTPKKEIDKAKRELADLKERGIVQ